MNERDRIFILGDVKEYVQRMGAIRFLSDLSQEFPEIFNQIKDHIHLIAKPKAKLLGG